MSARVRHTQWLRTGAAIVLAAVVLVCAVLLAQSHLRGARLDLTADRLFTISPETERVLDGLDEPVTLTLYFSREAARGVPHVRQYAQRVEELLRSYAARSDGRVRVRVVDPKPLTRWRDRAIEHGLKPVPASSQDTRIYLGLVGTNRTDGVEAIAFFDPQRERFLEYEVTRLIEQLASDERPTVGLLSTRPMTASLQLSTGQRSPPWAVVDRIREVAEVRELNPPLERIDPDIDVLMLVHPRGLDTTTLYAIDQYMAHGGRTALFWDPVAGTGTPYRDGAAAARSDLAPLMDAWGIEVSSERALADPSNGLVVSRGEGYGRSLHPGLIGLSSDRFAQDDVVTAGVDRIVMGSPGVIGLARGRDELRLSPIVRAAESAGLVATEHVTAADEPRELARGLEPLGEPVPVVARVSGRWRSAWPDGPPEAVEAGGRDHRARAREAGHMIVFADSDMLGDRLWIRQQRQGERRVRHAWAGNGDLVANAVAHLAGSDALIGLRGKGTSARPFTRVRALERAAAERLGDERSGVRQDLEAVQKRIESLRSGGREGASVVLDADQRAELERLRERRADLRARLRELEQRVQGAVAALGARLKLLNIAVMPLLVALAGALVYAGRRRRRRRGPG
jgi:ABC-type uncharacterized transport system involved in gliding motility auxiliary subunit